ncbi:molybdopterin-dependent oxidoreductase, partial [Chloroflexota bacterium]
MAETTTLNTCMATGCHTGCIHRTRVKDGKIVKVEKIIYPHGEDGTICLKAVAGARLPYHPDRLKYPLKRTGERGEGKWEQITWEQALDEIADKIKNIIEEYGPEAVRLMVGGSSNNPMEGTQHMLGHRLNYLLRSSYSTGSPPQARRDPDENFVSIDSNLPYAAYVCFGSSKDEYFSDPRTLLEGNTKYIISWGSNPAEMHNRMWKYISEAQKRGAKLVDIGLLFDETAQKADWWIPVKAGSDAALALAMISVIINEKLHDEEYVLKYTNGPILVRADNGKFLRESDILSGGDPQKYIIWDTASGQAKTITPKTYEIAGSKPALLGTYKPGGIECKPAFQILADLANQHLPEKVEEITGVSAENIKKLAREFATTKPAAIIASFGLRYKNAGNTHRAMATLGALTGNVGEMGGGLFFGMVTQGIANATFQIKFNDIEITSPALACAKPAAVVKPGKRMIAGRPNPVKAMLTYGSNPLHTNGNPRRSIEEVYPDVELIVVDDIFMTATAEYADYVLPDCTIFERDDIDIGHEGYIILIEKAIEPMYECRPPIYLWSELAKRLGFGEYFNKTFEEWVEIKLNSKDPSIAGIEPPLTLERLKKEKMVRANVSREILPPFADKKFFTPSGRIEFYNEELISTGECLPVFR